MQKRVMVVANSDWLLYHFRLPLLKALREEGLELVLICPEGEYGEDLEAQGFRLLSWNMNRKSLSPIKTTIALAQLVKYYRQFQPAAVHHITIQPIFYGSLAARIGQVPVVINNFTGLGYLFSESTRAFWLRQVTLPILRWATAGNHVFTVLLNDQDRATLMEKNLIREGRSTVIPGDGVDLNRFHPPTEEADQREEIVVLMAARLLWDKGVAEYVQAAADIKETHERVQFWLAGAPDPGNPTSIPENKVEELQERGVVQFLGYREDMASILREVDIAVLPSYHEGIPVFLLEAAASALPLVATDLEGCRMIIQDGVNGYLIPTGNVEDLSKALSTLITDPDLRESMGEKSREIVEKEYDQDHIVEQFLNLYQRRGILSPS